MGWAGREGGAPVPCSPPSTGEGGQGTVAMEVPRPGSTVPPRRCICRLVASLPPRRWWVAGRPEAGEPRSQQAKLGNVAATSPP
jgi:hypothetical protein